jgi:hypothetical protein
MVYRIHSAMLHGYDHYGYADDIDGRLVPNAVLKVWHTKGDVITTLDRTHVTGPVTYIYKVPSESDGEADLCLPYAAFEERLP